jgi:hypothetical protein
MLWPETAIGGEPFGAGLMGLRPIPEQTPAERKLDARLLILEMSSSWPVYFWAGIDPQPLS